MTNPFTVTPLTVTPGRGEGGGEPLETGRGCIARFFRVLAVSSYVRSYM